MFQPLCEILWFEHGWTGPETLIVANHLKQRPVETAHLELAASEKSIEDPMQSQMHSVI